MEKVETSLNGQERRSFAASRHFFLFLKIPSPGYFPDTLQEDIVKGFIGKFKIPGNPSSSAAFCLSMLDDNCDRGLKDPLFLYARLQLYLTRDLADGSSLVEQFQDVLGKELDQMSSCTINLPWKSTSRDDKCGSLTSSQCGLMELAALVFCRIVVC
ncbi:hypothetical protein HAX54_036447 [Datura stramonium]|uniref:Uncharacterized protein n=1 Tax=Datura stramonium TaxID=4076 RepID=A0ABS8SG98_DATST|nr:hypothetical protein [Datura stramonium]